jgi:hypothetical protein
MSWLFAPVATVVISAILTSSTWIAMRIYKWDLDRIEARTRLLRKLDVVEGEMVRKREVESLTREHNQRELETGQQHQRELEILRKQHAAALRKLKQEAASELRMLQAESSQQQEKGAGRGWSVRMPTLLCPRR